MEQVVSFPGLGLEFTLNRVAFHVGSRPIYWYGILIALGFLLAVLFIYKRSEIFGLDKDRVFDVTFITIILGIIGARAYYVAFSFDTYKDNLLQIFNTSKGGLAIYGGIIFGLIGVLLGCKLRKVKVLPMLDLVVGGLLIGQIIGRWGNFINVEAFGGNTSLPWGMTSPSIVSYLSDKQAGLEAIGMTINPTQPVHPTFLYESIWCLVGFIVILLLTKIRKFDGQLTLTYFAWYGFGRFFFEGMRTDSLMLKDIRVSQLIAALCFVASVITLLVVSRKIKKSTDPSYLQLYAETEEAELIRNHEFYADDIKRKAELDKTDSDEAEEKTDSDEAEEKTDSEDTEDKEDIKADDSIENAEEKEKNIIGEATETVENVEKEIEEEIEISEDKEETSKDADNSEETNKETKEEETRSGGKDN